MNARPPSEPIEFRNTTPNKIIVHHTATENSTDTSQAHAFWLCRYIQDLHMDTNGWIDTGQNFTNSRGGHLMEGRHQSLQARSEERRVGKECRYRRLPDYSKEKTEMNKTNS